uniref:EGF-like domain-containing protein n=1 Tax=Timema shepardi TaxID=629360 RepID=A0A7R9ASZ2_TIMSH|nr:unnamed protein product [Timema shepardi]
MVPNVILAVSSLLVYHCLFGVGDAADKTDDADKDSKVDPAALAVLQEIVRVITGGYLEQENNRRYCGQETIRIGRVDHDPLVTRKPDKTRLTPYSTPTEGEQKKVFLSFASFYMVETGRKKVFRPRIVPKCCKGYELNASTKCVPQCFGGCTHGRCVAPEMCRCSQGYTKDASGHYCVPTCDAMSECHFGACMGSECVCFQGYTNKGKICVPTCEGGCHNGNCTEPQQCVCNKGTSWWEVPTSTWKECGKPFKGYLMDPNGKCMPVCKDGCVNATCIRPNYCSCNDGFEKKGGLQSSNVCVPECDYACEHGDCTNPNFCSCHQGYRKKNNGDHICHPICDVPCENATCTSPNVCTCHPKYMFIQGSRTACKRKPFVCPGGCGEGTCTDDDICTCYAGHVRHPRTRKCVPHCSPPCDNGVCSAPGVCKCNQGYQRDFYLKTCTPVCSNGCVNADCTGPETCTCHQGYAKDTTDYMERSCRPLCEPYCRNGVCAAPNFCQCNPGYQMSPDSTYECI